MSLSLIGPDGAEYVLDGDDAAVLEALKAKGFREPGESALSPVEEGIETFKAGSQALVRGMTAGLSDAALNERQAKKAADLQAAHPVASTVGEIGGMLASPVGSVGNLVRGVLRPASALGRLGASVAAGGAEGVLFGAGHAVSEAALGDVELTAEKLAAGAGLGALLGMAGGGMGGAVEETARAVLPKAATLAKRAASALDEIANDATIKATRASQTTLGKLGEARVQAAARLIRDEGLIDANPSALLKELESRIANAGSAKGAIVEGAEKSGAKAAHMDILNRLDEFEAGRNPLQQDAIRAELRSVRRGVAKLGEAGSGFKALDDMRQSLAGKGKFSRGPITIDDETLMLKRQLAGVFRDEIDRQLVPQLGSDVGKRYADVKMLYGTLKDAARLAKSGSSKGGSSGPLGFGLHDLMAAAIGGSLHPMGIAAAVGTKVLREQGPAIVARIADRLAKEPALSTMARSFAAALPAKVPELGQYGAVLAQEAAVSPERALAAHIAHAQLDPSYAATAQLAGLMPETPDEQPAVLARAQTLAEAQAAAAAHDEAIRKGVERVFKGGGSSSSSPLKSQDFGAMRMRRDSAAAYDKRVEEIRALAADPSLLVDRVAANMGGLGQSAPGVTAALTNAAARAVQYLAQQAAVPPKAGPLAAEWAVPEADKQAFVEKLAVVQAPMSVLDDAAAGMLTEGQMDALRAVYPRLAQQISDAALERMTAGGVVPYEQRLMLFMLSGVDPDGSMSAEAIASNQAAIAAAKQPVAPVAPVGTEASDVTLAERTASPSQRREVRNEGSQ